MGGFSILYSAHMLIQFLDFWSWFPFGLTGVRLILIYFSALAVFILEIASLQLGRRNTWSPFDTIWRASLSFKSFQILSWYLLSAWWFGEVYIWSASPSKELGWIVSGGSSAPDKLNERPIHLRSFFFMLALFQTVSHLYNDYSSVHIPVAAISSPATTDISTHQFTPTIRRIQSTGRQVFIRCASTCGCLAFFGPLIYTLTLRQLLWKWHLRFAKLFNDFPRSEEWPTGPVPDSPNMRARFFAGFLLMATWEASLALFSAFLAQEPLAKENPLSTSSKDPNGTLITGLAAKRDLVRTFAFWELVVIAQNHPQRRKAIFADIDRPEGPAWSQMLKEASAVIGGVCSRAKATVPKKTAAVTELAKIEDLPTITAPIKKKKNIYAANSAPKTNSEVVESLLSRGAKRLGQSPRPYEPDMSGAVELIVSTADDVHQTIRPKVNSAWSRLKNSPVGWFFSTTFSRRVNTVILGSPQANAALIVDAIEATTRMLTASLSEDAYGTVIVGVPDTVRLFTATIVAIETFVHSVEQAPGPNVDIEEVEIIYARLKAGLAQLLSAFQLYLVNQGLSAAEHRAAENASRPGRLVASSAVSAPAREEGASWDWVGVAIVRALSNVTDVTYKLLTSWNQAHDQKAQVQSWNRLGRRPEMEQVPPSAS